jgi:hypothetical protein
MKDIKFLNTDDGIVNINHIIRISIGTEPQPNGDWCLFIYTIDGDVLLYSDVSYQACLQHLNDIELALGVL